MAVPRVDPRSNRDRVYQYGEYQLLSATFGRRKPKAWYEYIPPFNGAKHPRVAVRLLPYKLAMLAGILVGVAALAALSMLRADTARLEYALQDYSASIVGLDQSINEAVAANIESENDVITGGVVSPADVVYPARTKYLVLTNIPVAEGKALVRDLYPLSRRIIKIEP